MERKIGEVFTCNGKLYQVVKGFSCNGCAFIKNGNCYLVNELSGPCAYIARTDKTDVIFKEIKGMEIKNNQLTIDTPEGMVIDVENSNLKEGIIKFRKKDIDYTDVCISLNTCDSPIIVSNNNWEKIKAISQLMDIADYYNKGWKPDWRSNKEYKYRIDYNRKYDEYCIYYSFFEKEGIIYFKNKEDAKSVIDNPNFRDILDAVYKN